MQARANKAFNQTGAVCALGASFVIILLLGIGALAVMGIAGLAQKVRT